MNISVVLIQTAAKELFAELERSAAPVLPLRFLVQLRASFPQFAEMSTAGLYKQQDAEECWTQLLYTLRERLQVCHQRYLTGNRYTAWVSSAHQKVVSHLLEW